MRRRYMKFKNFRRKGSHLFLLVNCLRKYSFCFTGSLGCERSADSRKLVNAALIRPWLRYTVKANIVKKEQV